MRIIRSIFNSTTINLNNMRMSAGALAGVVVKSAFEGYPTLISHDVHRPYGWNFPIAMYFRPDVAYLIGEFHFPETAKETSDVEGRYREVLYQHITENVEPYLERFKSLLGKQYTDEVLPTFAHCAAVQGTDLARKQFPKLFALEDDDGLIPLDSLEPISPGVYRLGELALFAHPFLRRSLSRMNTLNEPFLALLQDSSRFPDCSRKIALDPDLIGLADTIQPYIELQYWWGPKFSDDLSSVKNGVSRHGSDSNAEFYSGISKSEFGWYEQKGLKIFECEEIRSSPTVVLGPDQYGCRFVHSIQSPGTTNSLMHADGAIRQYGTAEMAVRDSVDIAKSGRKSKYKKTWRVDGVIPVSVWKELLTHYYRDNYLVGEYFGAKLPQRITEVKPTDRQLQLTDYIPVSFTENDGAHISFFWDSDEGGHQEEVGIRTKFLIGAGDDKRRYIESDGVDLLKMLRGEGVPVALNHGFSTIAFDDIILNHPIFIFRGEKARERLVISLRVLGDFFRLSSGRSTHINQSVTLATRFDDRLFAVSFAGHVANLARLMDLGDALFPVSQEAVSDWADNLESLLEALETSNPSYPSWDTLVSASGQIYLRRRMLEYSELAEQDGRIGYRATKTESEFFEQNNLLLKPAWIIQKSHCTFCGQDYNTCPCVKLKDENAGQAVDSMDLAGCHFDIDARPTLSTAPPPPNPGTAPPSPK